MALGYDGHKEILDPTPIELPLGYEHPQTLEEKIAQAIRQNEFNKWNNELETFEEADDFDVEDEEPFQSQYEMKDMQDEPVYLRPKSQDTDERENQSQTQDRKEPEKSEEPPAQ